VKPAQTDDELIQRIVARLCTMFPELGATEIAALVEVEFRRFDGNHVRDYLPILTERAAIAECRRRST
jgi:hypothetical protein